MERDSKGRYLKGGKGRPQSAESRRKISEARKGMVFSEETRRRIGEASRGRKQSEDTISKRVEKLKGQKRTFTDEWRANMSKAQKGRISPMKGKKMPKAVIEKIRATKLAGREPVKSEKKHLDTRYKEWMRAVKNRDGWQCRIANGDCSGRLEAHHILNWVDYSELRYKVNNGITLCQAHHPRGRAEEKRLILTFKELVTVSRE